MWRMSTVQQHLGKCVIRWVQLVMIEWNSNFSLLSVNSHYVSFAVLGLSAYLTVWNFTTIVCCLGTFAKLCNVTIGVVMSVCLSVHMEQQQLSSHWTDFNEIWYLSIFCTVCWEFKFHYNLTRIMGNLCEDPTKYIYDSILLNSS